MSGSNTAISRRRLLQGAGAMWLLSVSQVSLAAVSQVVAVRVWPASSYTRVTVESNRQLKYKQFALSNPERVVVDIEDVNLNSVLKGMAAQIRADDPFIKSARVGQFDPQTVRMVFELKQNVKPQLFALAPVAGFKERLVMDLYPANAQDMQDPLLALLEDYNKGDLEKQVPPAQSGPQPGKAGRDRPIVMSRILLPGFLPGTGQEYNAVILHGAQLLYAYGEATVPKITVTLRKSYGGSHIVMGSKQLHTDLNYAWPSAEIAVMGASGAAAVLYAKEAKAKKEAGEDVKAFIAEKEDVYNELFANPYQAAKYGYIDDVIEPRNTRFRICRGLAQLATKRDSLPAKKHGNIPM